MTSYKVWNYCVAHDNNVPETFRCKDCLPWRFRLPRNDDPGKKHLLATERILSNLAGIQTVHSWLTSSQHIPTIPETPDSLLVLWFSPA